MKIVNKVASFSKIKKKFVLFLWNNAEHFWKLILKKNLFINHVNVSVKIQTWKLKYLFSDHPIKTDDKDHT